MTHDKIKHYIGEQICNHLSSLTSEQLQKTKCEIIQDMNLHKLGTEILFKRTVELEFINKLLNT